MALPQAKFEILAQDNTQKAFASVHKNLNHLQRGFTAMKTALLSTLGAAGLGSFLKTSLDVAGRMDDLSNRLGASSEALSQYRHVAQLAGVEFETLVKTWEKMHRNIALAAANAGPAQVFLKKLGIDAKSFAQLKPEEQFEQLADKLMAIKNPGERAAYAFGIMGKTGVEMLQVMTGGRAAIQAVRDEADHLGLTLTRQTAKAMASAGDQLDKVKMAYSGLGLILARELTPVLLQAGEAFLRTVSWIRAHADTLRDVAKLMMGGGVLLVGFKALPILLSTVGATFAGVSRAVNVLSVAFQTSALTAFNTALYGVQLSAIAATGALGKLKIAASGLFAAFTGWQIGTWLHDNFVQARVAGLAFIGALLKGWEDLKYAANVAWLSIATAFNNAVQVMKNQFGDFLSFVANGLNKLPFAGNAANALTQYADKLKTTNNTQQDFKTRLTALSQQHQAAKTTIDNNITSLVAYELNMGKTKQATTQHTQQIHHAALALGDLGKAKEKTNKLLEEAKRLTEEVRTPQEIYQDQLRQINSMLEKGYIGQETYNRALQKYKKELDDATGVTEALKKQQEAYEEHVREISDIFKEGLFAFLDEGFNGMVKSFENALKKMAAEAAAQEISHMIFGNAGKGAAGGNAMQFLTGGGGFTSIIPNLFGGFRANGGAVTGGKSYVVGEQEPELFTPHTSGFITPQSKLPTTDNTTTVVIHNHIQTPNAASFQRAEGNLVARMKRELDKIGRKNL